MTDERRETTAAFRCLEGEAKILEAVSDLEQRGSAHRIGTDAKTAHFLAENATTVSTLQEAQQQGLAPHVLR